jgi:hypothetical protein
MPRYFFHIYEHDVRVECDAVGIDLPSAFSHDDCARIIGDILKEAEWQELLQGGREFRIVDETGRPICSVSFAKPERSEPVAGDLDYQTH